MTDYTKDFFQQAWGKDGYYENFSYGLGIDKVCEVGLSPFYDKSKSALEIGSGGGVFTERMQGKFKELTVIDVIKKPVKFNAWDIKYIEQDNQSFDCKGVPDESIDFAFSYNVFCHLSNDALKQYLHHVHKVLKNGGDFVFMLSKFEHQRPHFEGEYELGDMLPTGHFYQDRRTLPLIASKDWTIVNSDILPDHRDILIHLRK